MTTDTTTDATTTDDPDWFDDLDWYKSEHAHGVTVAALRGRMAVKAVDLDDDGTLFPILVEPDELDDMTETTRDAVPDSAEEFVLDEHRKRSRKIAIVAGWADE